MKTFVASSEGRMFIVIAENKYHAMNLLDKLGYRYASVVELDRRPGVYFLKVVVSVVDMEVSVND